MQRPNQLPQPIPTGTSIFQVFNEASETLLILGAPGSGKTTLLLELTRDLLNQAAQDEDYLIPVVFNLSSWTEQRLELANWLVDELNKLYDVPRELAKSWVENGLVLPLLDGLDEIAPAHRESCVTVINTFIQQHGPLPLVVCSREANYNELSTRLRLSSAVFIQSLTRHQIEDYLVRAGEPLAKIRTMLLDDEYWCKFLNTPLTLTLTTLAFQGLSAGEIRTSSTTPQDRLQYLFTVYVNKMFERPGRAKPQGKTAAYTPQQTIAWLGWLANTMQSYNQTDFYLSRMQPDWLTRSVEKQCFRIGVGLSVLVAWLIGGLILDLILGFIGVLILDSILWLNGDLNTLLDREMITGLNGGLSFGLSFGLIIGLSSVIKNPLHGGLIGGLIGGLSGFLIGGLGLIGGLRADRLVARSNQRKVIWLFRKYTTCCR